MEKQIEEMVCKNCIHYHLCVHLFRVAKEKFPKLLFEEESFFARADDCDFYADKRIYRKQEWIRVEDALPKNDFGKPLRERKQYIVFTNSGTTSVVTYGYHEYDWWCGAGVVIKGVTHWMPSPEPPKGE